MKTLLALLLLNTSFAHAAQVDRKVFVAQLKAACLTDAQTLCPGMKKKSVKCLRTPANVEKLSPACSVFLNTH